MAMQSFQLDPAAGGVSQATFDTHIHNYRKITRIGVATKKDWSNPVWKNLVDDSDNIAAGTTDIEAAGLTVATAATNTPV